MPSPGKNDNWTSLGKAARLLGITRPTVLGYATRGELVFMVADGRTFISLDSITAFIARRDQAEPAAATA